MSWSDLGQTDRGEKMERQLSYLALRASVGVARLGVNRRPLPPERNHQLVCNQTLMRITRTGLIT